MSGICGMWQSERHWRPAELDPMLQSSGQPDDSEAQALVAGSAIFGVVPRWPSQSVASYEGVLVTTSADLCNLASLTSRSEVSTGCGNQSTAELMAQLYLAHGVSFVEQLEGSFSIALWDSKQQQLVLAVDHMGLETLFWTQDRGRLLFATRLGAVAAAKADIDVDPAALVQFLLHTVVPAPLTIYKNVQRLQPGTMLICTRGEITTRRYWDLNYKETAGQSASQWAEQLRETMRRTVHSHVADQDAARTGAYLSGGTDSSSVLAFASEKLNPVNTFSIYFENPRYDEISFARTAAEQFGARHHEQCLQASDAADAIPKIVDYFDEPFANSSAIGAYHCARLARENGVEMLLAGDGGDELFAGNERYASDKKFALYHSVPQFLRKGLVESAANLLAASDRLSLPARYIRRANLPNPRRMFSYSFFLSEAGDGVFEQGFLEQVPRDRWLDIPNSHYASAPNAQSDLNRLLYLDVKMTLADNDVRKVRGTAEMAGVRVRFPLMDHRLAEFSGTVPARLKLKGWEKRFIFKQAMKGILPDKILYKKKHGFGVPVGYWALHNRKMQEIASVLNEPQSRQRGYFNPKFLARAVELNRTYPAYYGEVLWVLLVLELWHRRHFEGRTSEINVGAAYAS
jgi:asparagine synthase (glutamine-hydrolysing)